MSRKTPILRTHKDGTYKANAVGGLHHIKGNRLPYFSLTFESWDGFREDVFGAAHEEIIRLWPDLAPLAALHLSDINGVPRHAAGNGFYWLAGAVGHGFGDRYHGGNGSDAKTPEQCLNILAKHLRISADEAVALRDAVLADYNGINQYDRVYNRVGGGRARDWVANWCETQKPRWKAEADKAIADFGLIVYGDPWTPETQLKDAT